MWWLLAATMSLASEPCDDTRPLNSGVVSVAWVSPVARRASANTWLTVVPTARLRQWVNEQEADLPRMLQGLGLRRRATAPKRQWKVTIFEVDSASLCRPLAVDEENAVVAGLPVCGHQDRKVAGQHTGCGYSTDRAYETRGLDLLQIPWRDAVPRGFCVLPARRFLEGR